MDPKLRESIGLLRHQIISPVLIETGRAQMSYFRSLESREFDVPGRGMKKFKAVTMKSWLHRYKQKGFAGIVPRPRKDHGSFRKITPGLRDQICIHRKELPELSIVQFYDRCLAAHILGEPPLGMETLRRFLKKEGLARKGARREPRKRYEMSRFGELYVADFMHGPEVIVTDNARRKRKAILLAIIDDHSRMIVAHEWGFRENTLLLERVFKQGLTTYGIFDRLYVDNGSSFSSQYLARVCANLGIGLVHSKPYDSPSRGKVERFFRTVRESFLSGIHPKTELTLASLTELFATWLRTKYHHAHHGGIDTRPIDRYQASVSRSPLRRIDEEALNEFFLVAAERSVGKDATVSYGGVIYEVPPEFIGKRVTLKFVQERPTELYLYDESDIRVGKIMPVDAVANGKIYRPSARDPHVPFQDLSRIINDETNPTGEPEVKND